MLARGMMQQAARPRPGALVSGLCTGLAATRALRKPRMLPAVCGQPRWLPALPLCCAPT